MMQIRGDVWTVAGFNAGKYIARIRYTAKKEYARKYLAYVLSERKGPCPNPGTLPTMAAQAVRLRLDEIFRGCPPCS